MLFEGTARRKIVEKNAFNALTPFAAMITFALIVIAGQLTYANLRKDDQVKPETKKDVVVVEVVSKCNVSLDILGCVQAFVIRDDGKLRLIPIDPGSPASRLDPPRFMTKMTLPNGTESYQPLPAN